MFVRTKIIHGRPRNYLVQSGRDDSTGKSRQRHIAYVDGWSKADIEKLKKMHEALEDASANAIRADATKAFKAEAAERAARLKDKIFNFKRDMTINLQPSRAKTDRRRPRRSSEGGGRALDLQDRLGKWCSHIIIFKQEYLKAIREKPLAERTPSEWEKVVSETEWMAEARNEALRLLAPS